MVERNTGGDQDTPRIWERRCGFPTPERNANGEPVDRAAQIRRLQAALTALERARAQVRRVMRRYPKVPTEDLVSAAT